MVTISQIKWINNNLDILYYLEQLGVDVSYNMKCLCPFHYNVNTPAAKVYLSNEGGNGKLFCYAERKSYSVYDVIKKCGYSDNEITAMVPREYWYDVTTVYEQTGVEVPLYSRDDKVGVFELLYLLDIAWENKKNYKCVLL